MSLGVIVSSAALIISLLVTAIKFVDWLSHSHPRAIMRMGRLGLLAVALSSLPALMALLAFQQWTGAMLLGAAMLLGLALVNWRRLVPRRVFRPLWVDEPAHGPPQRFDHARRPSGPDPELARRAAIVLQDYLALAGRQEDLHRLADIDLHDDRDAPDAGSMDVGEAVALLGLQPGASAAQIRAAHRRLMQLVHPDRGGTDYLAMKINRAKDVLLAVAGRDTPARVKKDSARKPSTASRNSRSRRPAASVGRGRDETGSRQGD